MSKSKANFLEFFRKNAGYLILALCVFAVGLAATLAVINDNSSDIPAAVTDIKEEVQTPAEEITDPTPVPVDVTEPDTAVSEKIVFILPVTEYTAVEEYSDAMVYNRTLSRYSSHKATDFYAAEGTEVYCVYDGVVSAVTNGILTGYTVTVDHGNGLTTVYNSLSEAEGVSVGQSVKKGDTLGYVSVTNRQEYKAGAHLHFEVKENGVSVDPSEYLFISVK